MSFGSSGGFGGFGTNNQQPQQNTGFGGFGANNTNNNNTTGGFGTTGNTGFGGTSNNSAGGSLFGGTTANNTTTSGFGSGGFGSATQPSSGFGAARPAFGASTTANTGGGLFGGTNTSSGTGFGGFGSTQQNNTTSGFGSSAPSSGGLFGQTGQQQSGFGSTTTPTNSLFGGASNTNNTFGNSAGSNTGFGQPAASGFGASASAQNSGTGGTPFSEHTEKDTTSTSKYQSITCLPQYQGFSFEELRTTDYAQGRKYGNQNGQAGAFGTSTGFGGGFGQTNTTTPSTGFGASTGGSLFGQQPGANPAGGFGTTPTSTGFGQSTGGGLFGQSKPAATGLFGSTPAATGTQSTGLFGSSNNTSGTGGFGSTATGGGLFGQNNQQQNKSLFGQPANTGSAFGSTNTGGFGQQSSTGTGLFGNNNNTQPTGFGQQNTQTSSPFGGFGQNNQAQQNQGQNSSNSLFGGGGGGFGQNQNKTPFGTTSNTTGSSLFGQPQQQPQSGGLFGNNNQQNQQGTSLFGAKPATGGSNLFGGAQMNNQTNTTGSNLFGSLNNQNQQNQGNSLFGQNQAKPSLFGTSNNTTTGGNNLFGGNLGQNNNQMGGGNSLFGNSQNQQPQMGGSLFGNSMMQSQQQPQQNQQLSTSIMSNNPYGNDHLFANLGTPTQAVGPLATPLSSSQKARKPTPLPMYKLNPAASTRLITPQKRPGYGFEYSSYGTPGSALSNASPGMFGSSLLQTGRFGNTLGRSLSANNIRSSSLLPQDSILNAGAFGNSTGLSGRTTGLKRLHINRSVRTDLFAPDGQSEGPRPSPPKKNVSFSQDGDNSEQQNGNGNQNNESTSTALVPTPDEDGEGQTPTPEEQGLLRSSKNSSTNSRNNGGSGNVDMEQVQGKALTVVPENESVPSAPASKTSAPAAENARLSQTDQEPGEYYMVPSMADLQKMSRTQLSSVTNFVVGRQGVGEIEFGDVDLTTVELDKICGDIVRLETRSATVYADHANKPTPGKGLNVPSKITLNNSWPRSKGGSLPVFERKGPRFDKHIDRLHRVEGTHFVDYKVETGQWIFRVDHFSTYKLDYDEIDSPTPMSVQPRGTMMLGGRSSHSSSAPAESIDDTFEYRRSRGPPGSFDEEEDFLTNESTMEVDEEHHNGYGKNDMVEQHDTDIVRSDSSIFEDQISMGASFASFDGASDTPTRKYSPKFGASRPKSILKASQHRAATIETPLKVRPAIGADWATQLQRTISPKKQNRQALRESQGVFSTFRTEKEPVQLGASTFGRENAPFATSIDVMNSLFGKTSGQGAANGKKQTSTGKGFQWPYAKRHRIGSDANDMTDQDRAFHNSFKPSWASDGTLVYAAASDSPLTKSGILVNVNEPVVSDGQDVQFARFSSAFKKGVSSTLKHQRSISQIKIEQDVPRVRTKPNVVFNDFASAMETTDQATKYEKLMWQLAAILFDPLDDAQKEESQRKEAFQTFWKMVVEPAAMDQAEKVKTKEENAIVQLSMHDIWGATETLMLAKDYRLATMVAQLGGSDLIRREIKSQIDVWRDRDDLSEISSSIRTLYELLAGNTCVSKGKTGAGRENKAETFNISSKFGLDWKRAFGLKLWYGTSLNAPLATAVNSFWEDVKSSEEKVRPVPWFVEENVSTGWEDKNKQSRQDILWGLLQIYASLQKSHDGETSKLASSIKLGEIITPQNLAGNPVDARLSFQLYQLLSSRMIIDFDQDDREHQADVLTADYAFQLAASGDNLCDAIFVTLHLHDAAARQAAIAALLNRHAGVIGDDETKCEVYRTLKEDFHIPLPWIWTAKALYAKAVLRDQVAEVRCLIRAGELTQAHETLRKVVAPTAIIEEDLKGLANVLEDFAAAGAEALQGWGLGGGVYVDFTRLMLGRAEDEEERGMLVKRLVTVLPEMTETGLLLEERVAIAEMGEAVAKVAGPGFKEARQVLVSMEGDRVLQDAVRLSESFYASVRVGGW